MAIRGNLRTAITVACALATLGGLPACTSDGDPAPRSLVDGDQVEQSSPVAEPGEQAVSGTLGLALLTVPARAEYVSFTDVAAVKERLGYADLTSESPTSERLEFWERARADGSMLTGTRLYDDTSLMSIDYGWTGEDVDWEVDFSASEVGCVESMLCDRASGYVLGLRKDLEWRVVLQSLADNGFTSLSSQFGVWATDDPHQPFSRVLVIPELHAIASGNQIGVQRIGEVVGGAPALADSTTLLASSLNASESAYLDVTGCVGLGEALGPDAEAEDVAAYFKSNDPSTLAEATAYGVGIDGSRSASAVLELASPADAVDAAAREAVIAGWPGLQSGQPFSQVATAQVEADGSTEATSFDVRSMPAFISMVLTHDAPWALCPIDPPK